MWVSPLDPDSITLVCRQGVEQDLHLRCMLQSLALLLVNHVQWGKVIKKSTEPLVAGTAKGFTGEVSDVRHLRGITVP